MFYDKFQQLCSLKKTSCNRAAIEIGLSNSITTKWKNTGATPDGATLEKIANFFGVPIDALLETEKPEDSSSGLWDGERLRKERTSRGYSIEYIIDRIGISEVYYLSLESNAITPSVSVLAKLADCFHCSMDYLYGRIFQAPNKESSWEERDLLIKFRQLDDRGRATVMSALNSQYEGIMGDALTPAPKEA